MWFWACFSGIAKILNLGLDDGATQGVTRRGSNDFKKLVVSAGWAYRVAKAKEWGGHVALDAEELQICWVRTHVHALATFHEMQSMRESGGDSLVFT